MIWDAMEIGAAMFVFSIWLALCIVVVGLAAGAIWVSIRAKKP